MKKSLSFISLLLCLIPDHECNGMGVLEDVVSAIEKGIAFYASSYKYMNIDGIFGLRVLEGQLALVEMHLKTNSHLSDDIQKIYKRIVDSYRQARDISALALVSLNESDQHYYRLMRPVIQRPWSFGKNYRRLDLGLKWKKEISLGKEVALTENQSDNCMSELLGSQTGMPCSISDECVTVMSTMGMNGYGITHQLLYTMLAEQSGCFDILNSKLLQLPNRSVSVEHLRAEFCVNNFYETSSSVLMQNGIINAQLHDLFLQQELVCAMLGYVEFLHIEWLRQIISWQMPSGCYGDVETQKPGPSVKRRPRKSASHNFSNEATGNIMIGRPTPVAQFVPPDERMPLAEQKQIGNLGSLNQIAPFVQKDASAAVQKLVGHRLNLRRNKFNASQIHRRAVPVLGYTPMAVERGKLGEDKINPIKTNRIGYGNVIKGKSKHSNSVNHDQGKVGDTRMRIKGNGIGDSDRLEHRPINDENTVSDNESFNINRRINRKLLYEKVLKDGCLAHKTAVAMGALTQYLRFVIFANASKVDALKHLFGTNYLMHPDSLLHSPDDLTSFVRPVSLFPLGKPTESSLSKNGIVIKVNNGPARYDRKDNSNPGNSANMFVDAKLSVNLLGKSTTTSIMSDIESYDDAAADAVEVPATNPPIVKNDEDELLLYDELLNMKAGAKSVSKAMRRRQVTASSFQVMIDSSFEGVASISSTYGIVSIMTVVILLLLYRSLRKHRFGIQHRQTRWR